MSDGFYHFASFNHLEHRVYRKTIEFLGQEEEINFCDACGTEVYPGGPPTAPADILPAIIEMDTP